MLSDVLKHRAGLSSSGDYTGYRRYSTRRLKKLRVRENLTVKASKTYEPQELGPGQWELALLLAERAWAAAMTARAALDANVASSSVLRSQILSKLAKAVKYANLLFKSQPLEQTPRQKLEFHVYVALLTGEAFLERQQWTNVVKYYAQVRVGLLALTSSPNSSRSGDENLFSDLLASSVDPGLRLALAHERQNSSADLAETARQSVLSDSNSAEFAALIKSVSPEALSPETATAKLSEIQFRQHTAQVKYNKLAEAIISARSKDSELDSQLEKGELDASFDSVMAHWDQLVFDTSSLVTEINSAGQQREQDLDIILTYAQFNLLYRRIQRDSLAGSKDIGKPNAVRLYDVVLQSCKSMGELPGVFNDEELSTAIGSMQAFFTAKRLLALSSLHPTGSLETLALVNEAYKSFVRNDSGDVRMTSECHDLPVSSSEIVAFQKELSKKLVQTHGVTVLIQEVRNRSRTKGSVASDVDFVQIAEPGKRLRVVDLDVKFIDPVPVKPVFYDIAFNYLQVASSASSVPRNEDTTETQPVKKKSLFGLF